MSDDSPRHDYEVARERLDARHGDGMIVDADYERITEFLDAYDEQRMTTSPPNGDSYLEPSSLKSYCSRITWVSSRMEGATLSTATDEDINHHMSQYLTGNHPDVKDEGYSRSTVRLYQSALRSFYQYHDDLDVDSEKIAMADPDDSPVDVDDLYTNDEVQRMREACPNERDRCLLELLINTGQRVRAIQTLRIKDVWPEEGEFRLNPSADGLKHAEGRRALFGARAAVKDWLQYHPTGDPEDYLITGLHANNNGNEEGDMLSRGQIRRRLQQIGNDANVDKPVHPHQFRHYSVTMMYQKYDLSLDQIRWQIGHGPDSRVLEATYRHLTDEDRIQEVEQQAGFREASEDASPFTPPVCTVCNEPLPEDARYCPNCGESYAPDAKQADDAMEDYTYKKKGEASSEEQHEAVDAVRDVLENHPEAKDGIVDLIKRLEN